MAWKRIGNVAGKDADVGVISSLQAEIVNLNAELSAAVETASMVSQVATMVATINSEVTTLRSGMQASIDAAVAKAVGALPVPKDGQSVTVVDVSPLIREEIAKAVAAIPLPKDGVNGRNGTDVSSVEVEGLVVKHVAKVVAALPAPKDGQDGRSLTPDDVVPLIAAEVAKVVSTIPRPKDGVGMLGALIDRDGQLVVTLSDGTIKQLGTVVGSDVDMGEVARLIMESVARIPVKEGASGKDGRDGTLENLKAIFDGERTITFCFKDGTQIEGGVIKLATVIYRGVYVPLKAYERGDSVSFGNQTWIALEDTSDKPGEVKTWQLAARRGGDGHDGKPGKDGAPGRPGKDAPSMGYRS